MNNDPVYSSSVTDDSGPICLSNRRRKMGFIGGSFEGVNHFRCINSAEGEDQNQIFKNFDKPQIKSFSIDCGEITQEGTTSAIYKGNEKNELAKYVDERNKEKNKFHHNIKNTSKSEKQLIREDFKEHNGVNDIFTSRAVEKNVVQKEPARENVTQNHRINDVSLIRSTENGDECKKEPIREYFLRNNGIIDICPIRGVENLDINLKEPIREDSSKNGTNNICPIRNGENKNPKEPITEDTGRSKRTENNGGNNEAMPNKVELLLKNTIIPKYSNESIDNDESDKENSGNCERKNDDKRFELEDEVTIKKLLLTDNSSLKDDFSGVTDGKRSLDDRKINDKEKRVRRTSSLKSPKESSNAEKKIVRFADALGLDLTDVRTFLDEIPSIPISAYSDLEHDDSPPVSALQLYDCPSVVSSKSLIPLFQQPKDSYDFLDKVRDNYVCLEESRCTESAVVSVSGVVRVRNLDFCKSVYVRYTTDKWQHYFEVQAHYMENSCDGFSDKFEFSFYLYNINIDQFIEFSIRFHCIGSQFWDNNNGQNYLFQCVPCTINNNSHYLTTHTTSNALCSSFY